MSTTAFEEVVDDEESRKDAEEAALFAREQENAIEEAERIRSEQMTKKKEKRPQSAGKRKQQAGVDAVAVEKKRVDETKEADQRCTSTEVPRQQEDLAEEKHRREKEQHRLKDEEGAATLSPVVVLGAVQRRPMTAPHVVSHPREPDRKEEAIDRTVLHCQKLVVPRTMACPCAREEHTSVRIGNKMYILGGRVQRSEYGATSVYTFHTQRKVWKLINTRGEPIPERYGHTAVFLEALQCLVMVGGINSEKRSLDCVTTLNLFEKSVQNPRCHFDTEHNPHTVRHHTAVAHMDLIYVFGGERPEFGRCNDLEVLDLMSMRWMSTSNSKAQMSSPPPVSHHTACICLDTMYVYGGKNTSHDAVQSVYAFDFNICHWELVMTHGDVPVARHSHAADIRRRHMYVHGGCVSTGDYDSSVYVLNLDTFVWNTITVLVHDPRATVSSPPSFPGRQRHSVSVFFASDVEEEMLLQRFENGTEESAEMDSTHHDDGTVTLLLFGGGGPPENVTTSHICYKSSSALYIMSHTAPRSNSPEAEAAPEVFQASEVPHSTRPPTASVHDKSRTQRLLRFRTQWNLDGAFAPVPPLTRAGKGTKVAPLSPPKVAALAQRLSSREKKEAQLARLRVLMGVPSEPTQKLNSVQVKAIARRMHDDQIKQREKKQQIIYEKLTRPPEGMKHQTPLPKDILDDSVKRLHDASIEKQQATAKKLNQKYIEGPMKVARDKQPPMTKEEIANVTQTVYNASLKTRQKLREKLEEKYLCKTVSKVITKEDLKSTIFRLYPAK